VFSGGCLRYYASEIKAWAEPQNAIGVFPISSNASVVDGAESFDAHTKLPPPSASLLTQHQGKSKVRQSVMAGATRARKLSSSIMGGRSKGKEKGQLDETLMAASFSVVTACATIVLVPESDLVTKRFKHTIRTSISDIGRGKQGILRVSNGLEAKGEATAGASAAKAKTTKEAYLSCFCVLSVNGTLQLFEDHRQLNQVLMGSVMVDHDTELLKGVEISSSTENDHFAIRCPPSAAAVAADPAAVSPLLFFCAPSKQEKTDWLKRVSNHIALPPHPRDPELAEHATTVHLDQAILPCMGLLEIYDSGEGGKPTTLKSALCWLERGMFRVYKEAHSLDPMLEFAVTGDSFVRRPSASTESTTFQVLNNRRAISLGPVREAPLAAHLATLARWEAAFMQHIRVYGGYTFDDDPLLAKASHLAEVPTSLTSKKASKSTRERAEETRFFSVKLTSAVEAKYMLDNLHRSGEWALVKRAAGAADAAGEEAKASGASGAATSAIIAALAAQLSEGSALRSINGELLPLYPYEESIARLERYSTEEAWASVGTLDVEMRKFPEYEGGLQLQEGGKKGSWKSRYLVLGNGELQVFDKKDGELKSRVMLACCTIGLLAGTDIGGKLFCFSMVEHGDTADGSTTQRRVFQTKNNKDCLEWAGRLCNAVAMSNGGGHILQLESHDLEKTVHSWYDRAANAAAAALSFQPGKKGEDDTLLVKAREDVFAHMSRAEAVKIALHGARATSSILTDDLKALATADVSDGAEMAQILQAFYSETAAITDEVSRKLARMKPHIREQAMKKKFLSFDYDGDGKLNEIEAMTLASELQKTLTMDELHDAMEKLELENQTEPLAFEKFSTWFENDLEVKAKSSIVSDFFALRAKFREYAQAPKNDDHRGEDAEAILQEHGVMSRLALKRMADDCNVQLRDPSEVSAAFAAIASDNNGITVLDFEKWWKAAK
jgi:hypothetical protein